MECENHGGTGNAVWILRRRGVATLPPQLARVNDEIKSYPQPIARCDAQLAGLLEERARIRTELERLAEDD